LSPNKSKSKGKKNVVSAAVSSMNARKSSPKPKGSVQIKHKEQHEPERKEPYVLSNNMKFKTTVSKATL
jgi:hypothetical protein